MDELLRFLLSDNSEPLSDEIKEYNLEELLYDKYEINIENFEKLINDLYDYREKSDLSGIKYSGFGTDNI